MSVFDNPGLTVALAMAAGLVAQAIASHLRVPGLVVLLAMGVLLGPDVADAVRPELLGRSLHTLVGFAVAVILFEGGLTLEYKRIVRVQKPIRRLITIGGLVSMVGGTFAAWRWLGWGWRMSVLFGSLVIVTGPTVVGPLLRRLKVKHSVATILEAEGVLIDAIGAVVAAATLEVVIQPSGGQLATAAVEILTRLVAGAVFGVVGGFIIVLPLRVRNLVPEGLENVTTLGLVLALYQISNALAHESGIAAVIMAGAIARNVQTNVDRELREFKEQLTTMFVGLLFVLLAADVRLADVRELGMGAVLVCATLIFVVRPVSVLMSTQGTKLDWKQKLFLAWIGPRGIVAAAIASLFVTWLKREGIEGGKELRALVFSVITVTVLWSGLTGGLIASVLGLRRKSNAGWVILGARRLARTMAKLLREDDEVVCIESNARAVREAEKEGIRVIYGNALEPRTLKLAEIDTRAGAVALTSNEDTNLLFLQRVRELTREPRICTSLGSLDTGVTAPMVKKLGAEVVFGGAEDIERWGRRLDDGDAEVRWWRTTADADTEHVFTKGERNAPYLPLVVRKKTGLSPATGGTRLRRGDCVAFLMHRARMDAATERLTGLGYEPRDVATSVSPPPKNSKSRSRPPPERTPERQTDEPPAASESGSEASSAGDGAPARPPNEPSAP